MRLTFESVDKIVWCDHSNESSLPVLSLSAICFSKCYKMKFPDLVEICLWLHLTVKGLNSTKSDQCEKFLLFTPVLLYFKQSGYKNRPLSTYENSAWWHVLGHKQRKWTNMFIIFFFLSPNIRLAIILNFYFIYRKWPIIRTWSHKVILMYIMPYLIWEM